MTTVIGNERRRLREIISDLYSPEMEKRFAAAKALGEFTRERPDHVRKSWNRIFYAFDDTMSCWGVSEGLGEIARNAPALRSKIILLLRKFQNDPVSCQGFVWAVCRIGQVDMDLALDFIPDFIRFLDSGEV